MSKIKLGIALCGSYCTYDEVLKTVKELCGIYDVTPIMSENSASTDSRFGKAEDFKAMLREFTGKEIIDSIKKAEPIGPQRLLDAVLIMPCTGNTIAKLANGITDSCVTMAAKAHLRNERPVIIAISTNDALGANARNIGDLMARKNIYFIPFYQDNAEKKPNSVVANFSLAEKTIESAIEGKQIQPLLLQKK